MKTKFMILFLGILLVGGVVAGIGLSRTNRTIDLDKDVRDTLTARGFDNITYEDFELGDDQVKRTMYQPNVIQTFVMVDTYYMNCTDWEGEIYESECLTLVRVDYTARQMEGRLDLAVAKRLERISGNTETPNVTKIAEGDIITRER